MSDSLESQLYRATILTFEELGFMLPSCELQEKQKSAACDTTVAVGFHGSRRGKLILAVGRGILPRMVANMLGEDEKIFSLGLQHDALGELANVICGNVLPGVADEKATFHLDPPRLVEWKRPAGPAEGAAAEVHLGLEEGRADVYLFLDREKEQRP